MHVPALCASALVRVLALVLVDAEGAGRVQLVTTRADAFEAAMSVLTSTGWWANSLKFWKDK